ncbi:hypothetical protein TorRG33x02_336350 [Trema orientale]|uniref:Uncharacterized protein n=1 Tax=Trema orientale TaxID=63057 RepID=A0A2P5B052_TREOI|nr:hypothetical protein TorRG33x02_336350 [Trema orientale]
MGTHHVYFDLSAVLLIARNIERKTMPDFEHSPSPITEIRFWGVSDCCSDSYHLAYFWQVRFLLVARVASSKAVTFV